MRPMPTQVDSTPGFKKDFDHLARKYPAVHDTVEEFVARLENDERPVSAIVGVGYDAYKARLPNRSARRGKSGGFRVIYYVCFENSAILITIYSKTEKVDVDLSELKRLLSNL